MRPVILNVVLYCLTIHELVNYQPFQNQRSCIKIQQTDNLHFIIKIAIMNFLTKKCFSWKEIIFSCVHLWLNRLSNSAIILKCNKKHTPNTYIRVSWIIFCYSNKILMFDIYVNADVYAYLHPWPNGNL